MILLVAAILPVAVLCYLIYNRDVNKEPAGLLAKIFVFGFVSAIPVVIVEMVLAVFFPTENVTSFILLFINIFVGVALVEEGFKWIVTKKVGFDDKEFDEIYDIIVYSVFASLGFACIENILYVFQYGFGNAIMRALTSIPGHTCFAVVMGYFFSKAKVASINNNESLFTKNMILSILAPAFVHAMYDTLIFYSVNTFNETVSYLFYIYHIATVCVCVRIVFKISKIQNNVTSKLQSGVLVNNNGYIAMSQNNNSAPQMTVNTQPIQANFCPVCGRPTRGANFCSSCGFKLK